eukprot:1182766-Prorocentrum_minimum.AAC.1
MTTQGMKNWEAQARTNSILAGSLKALEERLDELNGFVDWRIDTDMRIEEIFDALETLETKMKAVEDQLKKGNKATKAMGDMLKGGLNFGGGRRTSNVSNHSDADNPTTTSIVAADEQGSKMRRDSETSNASRTGGGRRMSRDLTRPRTGSVAGGGSEMGDAEMANQLESEMADIPINDPFFSRMAKRMGLAWKKYTKEENVARAYPYTIFFTFVLGIAWVWVFVDTSDLGGAVLPLLTGLSCMFSAWCGRTGNRKKSRGRLAMYSVMCHVVTALGAVYLQRALDDYIKTGQFCDLMPQPASDCSSREMMSAVRVLIALLTIILALFGAMVVSLNREKLLSTETSETVKKAMEKKMKGARGGTARTPYGTQSWDMQQKKSSTVSRALANNTAQLQMIA